MDMAMEVIMTNETQSLIESRSDHIDYMVVLDDMLKCFANNWWKILALVSIVCGITFIVARSIYTPVYRATSTFVVNSMNSAGHDRNQYNSTVTSQLGNVFPYLLSSDLMTKLVAEDLGTEDIGGSITAEALKDTSLITLKAEAGDAQQSYDILQSVIRNYPEVSAYVIGDVELKMMDESGVPKSPSNPPRFRFYAAVGGLAVIGISIIFLFLYAITRMTVRSEKDLKVLFNVPTLGSVPMVQLKKRSQKKSLRIAVDEKDVPYFFIESFRTIRNRLEKETSERELNTILVTSALPSEGKSTVAANLALSLAHKDRRVILVDGDMRNPSVEKTLQIEQSAKGIQDVLTGQTEIRDALIPYANNNKLQILTGHGSIANPLEYLSSDIFRKMLKELKGMADYVIIDTPPSAIVSDASIIAKHTDGCLFVVRQDYAKLDSLQEGMDMVSGSGTHVVGTVLNGTESTLFSGGYGYGYYGHGYYGKYGYSRHGYYGGKYGYGYGYGTKNAEETENAVEGTEES